MTNSSTRALIRSRQRDSGGALGIFLDGKLPVFLTNHHGLGASTGRSNRSSRLEAESEDQNLHRPFAQCGEDPDLDGARQHAVALSAAQFAFRLELVQLKGTAAHEPVHASRSDDPG